MQINTMRSNCMKPSILRPVLLVSAAAAPVSCPRSIDEAGSNHVLNNVSVFDGPPRKAFLHYGKGRHPAGLNLGDCASYALAKKRNLSILFEGNEFSETDLIAAA